MVAIDLKLAGSAAAAPEAWRATNFPYIPFNPPCCAGFYERANDLRTSPGQPPGDDPEGAITGALLDDRVTDLADGLG